MNTILVVGMARSGTTLVSHILGSLPNVHIEIEPHALWKSGNFKYLNDEEYDLNEKIIGNIKSKFSKNIAAHFFIEKSPINCLRPYLVHKVFPDAKIVYIERDPVRCIYSNYNRSLKKDSFKLSIILKKYFFYTGSEDLAGAISERGLFKQISFKDIPYFLRYILNMFYLRQVKGLLPFGPKLKNFSSIVKEKGLLFYHVAVYKASIKYKQVYKNFYKKNFESFRMEDIMSDQNEIRNMVEFIGIPYENKWLNDIQKTFDESRIKESFQSHTIDEKIKEILSELN